jgi:phosphoribosylglycinamide formyltransferase 1
LELPTPVKLVVLASGSGTLLQALLDATGRSGFPAKVVAVGADRTGIEALTRAERLSIPSFTVRVADHPDRAAWDKALTEAVAAYQPDLVVSAGFMKILGSEFLERFTVLNTHPALLPSFPGMHAVRDALAAGVKVTGSTVHFADAGVDTGPIIAQEAVSLPDATEPDEVRDALRPIEHELLTGAVRLIARGAVRPDPAHPRRIQVSSGRDGGDGSAW